MGGMLAPEGMYDVAMKPKLLRSLLREYVPNEKHAFTNPSELSYVVSTIKTHKLLSELTPPEVQQDLVGAWKSAVDSWLNRLLTLVSTNLPDKCWAGICLLGLTCQECSSERFLTSYDVWLNKLLVHLQPSVSSHFIKAASCASLSDMFTRLSEFSNAKKDGTSHATKVIQLLLKLLSEDNSAIVLEEAMCLLHTLIDFFPSSVHRHYDNVEGAIVSKLISGNCSPSVLKKLGRGLSLLPKAKGDEDSWFIMMNKILLYVNSQLNDAFQGIEEEAKSAKAMRALLPAGKEPPPPLGGLSVSEQNSDISTKRPERLMASRISSLLQCCSDMLTTSYPVMVSVPVTGLTSLAGRVLLIDGSLSVSSYSFMTTLKQEFICSEIPNLQFQCLNILTAIVKGLGSQLLPHVADILEVLQEFLRRCKFPDLKIKGYSLLKALLMSMGVGLAVHVSQDIIRSVFIDLDFSGDENDSKSSVANKKVQPELIEFNIKKRKRTKSSLQEQPDHGGLKVEMSYSLTSISVKIAALEALETLLTVGGSIRSESWRGNVDKLLITVATYACRGGWSKGERKILLSGDAMPTLADFQLAALRALLASLLSPGRARPSHMALGLELFRRGMQAASTQLAEYCGHALLALEVLIHPRGLPLSDFHSSVDDFQVLGHSPNTTYQIGEPESEDDDLLENWPGKDDEMEIQVTERQQDAHYADKTGDPSTEKFTYDKAVSGIEKDNVTTSENGPNDQPVPSFPVENDLTAKGDAVSGVGKGTEASNSEHVPETSCNEFSAIFERASDTLTYTDTSRGMMVESDNESSDLIPDIVDGDPDSD